MESFPNNNNNNNNIEELIKNFTTITGTEKDVAIYYLDKAKNNVNIAVTMFFDDTQENNNPTSKNNNNINNNNNIQIDEPIGFNNYPNYNNYHNINNNNINNNNIFSSINDNSIYNVNRNNNIQVPNVYPPVHNNNNNNNNNQEEGFFSKFILKPLKAIFCGKRTNSPSSYNDFMNSQVFLNLMTQIPNLEKNYSIFVEKIYNKIGILIIWNRNTLKDLSQLFVYINNNPSILETIKNNCICYVVKPNEVSRMRKIFNNDYEFIYPTLIFVSNKTNIKNLNKFSELTKMQGMDGITNLQNILDYSIEEKNKRKNYINNNSIPEDILFNEFSNGDIIAKQKNDLAELERQVQKKEKEERERKLKEEQEKKLIEEKKIQYLKQIEEIKKKIKPEPNQNDPNSTLIVLRYPNGEQRVERRFLKTDVIEDIYNFVTSLGREIYTENDISGFSIVQPFPPKVFNQMNKTLEEEGLVPNAILQIKEN
jgi:hypothetical protein